jgi:hypothetical protein
MQKSAQNTVATTSLKGNLSITNAEILEKGGGMRTQALRSSQNNSKVGPGVSDKIRS